jgi:cytochrome c553
MRPLFRPFREGGHTIVFARPLLGAALLASAFGAQAQQWTRGEAVWRNNACFGCHAETGNAVRSLPEMQSRLTTVSAARAAADRGAVANSGMAVIWNALGDAQKNDVAAFVANSRAEGNAVVTTGSVSMSVTAVGQSAQATVTLFNNGRAPLQVALSGGQTVSGDAAQFRLQNIGNGCDAQAVPAGGSCAVTVIYQPTVAPASQHSLTLTFTHNGEPTTTSRMVLTGRVAAAPAPAPSPAPSPAPAADGGGGALPLALWSALLPAALLARRRRR